VRFPAARSSRPTLEWRRERRGGADYARIKCAGDEDDEDDDDDVL